MMAEPKPAAYTGPVVPSFVADLGERVRPNTRLILLLALGHLVVDVNQGALPAILPFLRSVHDLSYAQAGVIVLMANVTSSLVQPVFGYFADQASRRWLLPIGVFTAGIGVGLTGVAPGYGAVLLLVVVMGLGVAAYHPEGYRIAASVAGERRATALSWFSLGGSIGIALGPPVVTALIAMIGLTGSLGLLVPSLVVAGVLTSVLPVMAGAGAPVRTETTETRSRARGTNMPAAMALLVLVVTIRSWTQLAFTTFVPFYYVDTLGADPRLVGPLLFVFLGAGALGTVVAGPVADRVGVRRFIIWMFLAAAPLGVAFLLASGPAAFVVLGLFGAVLVSSFTLSVVLGQAYMPRNPGMASGLVVGFGLGTGGLGVTLLGWVADHHGLASALWIAAVMPLVGFVLTLFLPSSAERRPSIR